MADAIPVSNLYGEAGRAVHDHPIDIHSEKTRFIARESNHERRLTAWRLRAVSACSRFAAASSQSSRDTSLRTAPCSRAISAASRSFIEWAARTRERARSSSVASAMRLYSKTTSKTVQDPSLHL